MERGEGEGNVLLAKAEWIDKQEETEVHQRLSVRRLGHGGGAPSKAEATPSVAENC